MDWQLQTLGWVDFLNLKKTGMLGNQCSKGLQQLVVEVSRVLEKMAFKTAVHEANLTSRSLKGCQRRFKARIASNDAWEGVLNQSMHRFSLANRTTSQPKSPLLRGWHFLCGVFVVMPLGFSLRRAYPTTFSSDAFFYFVARYWDKH